MRAPTSGLPGCSGSAVRRQRLLRRPGSGTVCRCSGRQALAGCLVGRLKQCSAGQAGTAPTSGLPGCSGSIASTAAPSATAAAAMNSSYVSECAVLCSQEVQMNDQLLDVASQAGVCRLQWTQLVSQPAKQVISSLGQKIAATRPDTHGV